MVIYSDEIKNLLDKIYFYEMSHRKDLSTPIYTHYEQSLSNVDKLSQHIPSKTFPLNRDKLFGLIIGRLEFGYLYDGINVSIECFVNRDPQNDWFDWLIKENSRTHFVSILTYINEQKYNTTYKMKNLHQYISEQMVCELSSKLLSDASLKAKSQRRRETARNLANGAGKALERELNHEGSKENNKEENDWSTCYLKDVEEMSNFEFWKKYGAYKDYPEDIRTKSQYEECIKYMPKFFAKAKSIYEKKGLEYLLFWLSESCDIDVTNLYWTD